MKKDTVIVFMIMSVFSILFSIEENSEQIMIIKEVVFIIALLGMETLNSILLKKRRILDVIEILIVLVVISLKMNFIIYLLPIIVFRIFYKSKMIYSIGISLAFLMFFRYKDYINISIYIIIINLYLNEVKKRNRDKKMLKEENKDRRDENYRMKEELDDLQRYLEQNKIIERLKERNFMAQKLHDHLGHRITSSLMQLEVTKETMESDKEMSKKYLNTAMDNLKVGMDEIRGILKGVKPKEKLLGIEEIREQILEFQYSSRMKTHLEVTGDLEKINLKLWRIIEQNLKESLTNVSKYSRATKVTVAIFVYNKILRVEVRDNGQGNDFSKEGLGLNGIRERTVKNGGRVEVFNDEGFVINTIFEI